eukprot:2370441-Rhodomonas_salina.1
MRMMRPRGYADRKSTRRRWDELVWCVWGGDVLVGEAKVEEADGVRDGRMVLNSEAEDQFTALVKAIATQPAD